MLSIHYLQHVEFEDLASIGDWARTHGHRISRTRLYAEDTYPSPDDLDWLVVMGGPMNIYETEEYPWLGHEKQFIRACIDADKTVLGICLGAQLIADVLGGKTSRNQHSEIGWFPVQKSDEIRNTLLDDLIPESVLAYHWHGDTFAIPDGAVRIASSQACENQGFLYGDKIIGLQYHLESTLESATALINHCGTELIEDTYVQMGKAMLSDPARFKSINAVMYRLLDGIATKGR